MDGTNPFSLFLILILLILIFDQDCEAKLGAIGQKVQKMSGACSQLRAYSGQLQQEVIQFLEQGA